MTKRRAALAERATVPSLCDVFEVSELASLIAVASSRAGIAVCGCRHAAYTKLVMARGALPSTLRRLLRTSETEVCGDEL
jgi:hypothetical protein